MVKLTPEAHTALTSWAGRLQRLEGRRVTLSDAVTTAVRLSDTVKDDEIATYSKGGREDA